MTRNEPGRSVFKRLIPGLLGLTVSLTGCSNFERENFDLVISGGRMVDPETETDGIRHIGIRDGVIAKVSTGSLFGDELIDATDMVVSPGFVDLHAHGQDLVSNQFQVMDGVTTALELEAGAFPIRQWYRRRSDEALINYGASVSHQAVRMRVLGGILARSESDGTFSLGESGDDTLYRPATDEELDVLERTMAQELSAGALGFGFGLSYTPGAGHSEILRLFRVAASHEVPSFVHLRSTRDFLQGGRVGPFQEVIANAAIAGAALHIVHLNSTAGRGARDALEMIRGARYHGIDVTTEAYPYTASASLIESPLFDGWSERAVDDYRSLEWVETGKRLTPETFDKYRQLGGWVIMHGRSEEINEWIVSQPDVIVASDGIPFSEGRAHPRGAGTFARVLGYYVRERRALTLMEALRKMTLLPARRLEGVAPVMACKGRIKVGCDADVTIFDLSRILDKATYDMPDEYSTGIEHVLVAGTAVVKDGRLVEGVKPGKPIFSHYALNPEESARSQDERESN